MSGGLEVTVIVWVEGSQVASLLILSSVTVLSTVLNSPGLDPDM